MLQMQSPVCDKVGAVMVACSTRVSAALAQILSDAWSIRQCY